MTSYEWLALGTTLLSPLFALQVSQFLERARGDRSRKEQIFKTLMSTRGAPLSRPHVEALNMIDVEFYGTSKKLKSVVHAWRNYYDQLAEPIGVSSPDVWAARKNDRFIDLLFAMGESLGYEFDRTTIKNIVYSPNAYGDAEADQLAIRKGLASVLSGERAIPVALRSVAPQLPAAAATSNLALAADPPRKREDEKVTSGA